MWGTYATIGQHSPIEGIQEAQAFCKEKKANVIVGAFLYRAH